MLNDFAASHGVRAVQHQKFDQSEFLCCQGDGDSCAVDAPAAAVDLQIGDSRVTVGLILAAANQRADASAQFGNGKGLWKAIVGTGVQSLDSLLDQAFTCKEHDGGLDAVFSQFGANSYPAGTTQAKVEQNQIVWDATSNFHSSLRPQGCIYSISIFAKCTYQKAQKFPIVSHR